MPADVRKRARKKLVALDQARERLKISACRLGIAWKRCEETGLASTASASTTNVGRRAVTAETVLRLTRYFGTTAAFWTGLQAQYDLEMAGATRPGQGA